MRGAGLILCVLLAGCATVAPLADRGVEVTVAFDRDGERAASATGLADPATGRVASANDPVRVASVSKLVVAIGVMRLVERGLLDLDADVSGALGYAVRNPAFPAQPITLRRLLSHTSSLRDHDDQYAIPLGETLRAVLDDPASWDAGHAPAAGYFRYANVNFPVVASVIERVTGERFDRWMRREVIAPLGIEACFNWPTCSDGAVRQAIVLTQDGRAVRDDLHGRRPTCPVSAARDGTCDLDHWRAGENGALFAPQGGLRISARGLARVGRMLADGGMIGGRPFLSRASIAALRGPAWVYDGHNGDTEGGFYCRYGLAVQIVGTRGNGCNDDVFGDGVPRFGHAGEAYGLRSGLWVEPIRGGVVAYYATGLAAAPPPGRSAFTAAEEKLAGRAVAIAQQRP